MRILDLALKDISQIFRDKKSLIFLALMPIVFTLFMGFAFNGAVEDPDQRPRVGWIDRDGGSAASQALFDMLESSPDMVIAPLGDLSMDQAAERVRSYELAAVVETPAGFSDRLLAGEPVRLALIADANETIGQAAMQLIRPLVVRALSAAEITRLTLELYPASDVSADAQTREVFADAVEAWKSPALSVAVQPAGPVEDSGGMTNPYQQTSPGIMVQFAVFGLINSAMVLVLERKNRTLTRMLTTSLNRASIILGHVLAMFAVVLFQEVLLVLFGQFLLGVDYLRQPLAILAMLVSLGLFVTGFGLFVGVMAKTEDQVIMLSLIGMFVISALGGAWFPLDVAGPAFSRIGHFTPGAWAMDGFQNIIIRGLGFSSVMLPAAILMGYGLLFFVLAVWRFRFVEN
jgi:ABC-2 type transport system permease protein